MKDLLKQFIIHQLLRQGIILTRVTTKKKIVKLIERLFPYQTQFDLIRFGPNGDGGYLIPNYLDGIEACFSPGVGETSEFELDCLKYGMKVHMADGSVENPNLDISEVEYSFIKKNVGCTNDDGFITMDQWVKLNCPTDSSELMLQMDIEGDEYNSIIDMSESLIERFRIMVIEFHNLQYLWNPVFFNLAQAVFEKILQKHICLHIHPNNFSGIDSTFGIDIPTVAEFTFIRKDCAEIKKYESNFPHKLDYDNSESESISLPQNWYRNI